MNLKNSIVKWSDRFFWHSVFALCWIVAFGEMEKGEMFTHTKRKLTKMEENFLLTLQINELTKTRKKIEMEVLHHFLTTWYLPNGKTDSH